MEDFTELGLTKNESKAYETLVKFGKLSAGETSSKSGIPYGRIYDVLDTLTEKGLINVIPEKTKKFVPGDPKELEELLSKKKEKLQKTEERIKELKKFYEDKGKNPIKMGIGKKAFYQILREMKEPEEYDYSIKWSAEYHEDWAKNVKATKRKGIKTAVLTKVSKENSGDIKKWLKSEKEMKEFPNEGVAMSIRKEEVLISLIKSNVNLLIKDAPFSKIMKKLFENSYSLAKTIK